MKIKSKQKLSEDNQKTIKRDLLEFDFTWGSLIWTIPPSEIRSTAVSV